MVTGTCNGYVINTSVHKQFFIDRGTLVRYTMDKYRGSKCMYSQEFIDYLVHFHGSRDYFECHEILEDYWKRADERNKDSILVAFILLAVSNYHYRRNNIPGAVKTLKTAIIIFRKQSEELPNYGFEQASFMNSINNRLDQIQALKEYTSTNLPIVDVNLVEACRKACEQKGFIWCKESDLSNENIVHRHLRRDRTEVILERNRALKRRQNKGRE